ncbi:MerR family transcriptional regulator [Streptomyces laculatispora]|uniref:MerR family transcriptional regulator n=1 Tax=Streptomyces laculatispora TaxID=887464 RepID=A0ABY9IG36_9ACTN|nr:MerR family transcriptional regulator [Streptomyces laculatispora]WLQ45013.1 MerR family transcriptional regulator [Streptomyces laculatispora]
MRIGELASRTGVSERSLRYYEEQGLLAANRTPGGHRDFCDGAVDRVIRIQELYAAGLPSSRIVRILPCMRDEDGGPSVRATPELVAELTAERDRIDRTVDDLLRSREVLDQVIDTAADGIAPDPAD